MASSAEGIPGRSFNSAKSHKVSAQDTTTAPAVGPPHQRTLLVLCSILVLGMTVTSSYSLDERLSSWTFFEETNGLVDVKGVASGGATNVRPFFFLNTATSPYTTSMHPTNDFPIQRHSNVSAAQSTWGTNPSPARGGIIMEAMAAFRWMWTIAFGTCGSGSILHNAMSRRTGSNRRKIMSVSAL